MYNNNKYTCMIIPNPYHCSSVISVAYLVQSAAMLLPLNEIYYHLYQLVYSRTRHPAVHEFPLRFYVIPGPNVGIHPLFGHLKIGDSELEKYANTSVRNNAHFTHLFIRFISTSTSLSMCGFINISHQNASAMGRVHISGREQEWYIFMFSCGPFKLCSDRSLL